MSREIAEKYIKKVSPMFLDLKEDNKEVLNTVLGFSRHLIYYDIETSYQKYLNIVQSFRNMGIITERAKNKTLEFLNLAYDL